jgi:hypothetical protein
MTDSQLNPQNASTNFVCVSDLVCQPPGSSSFFKLAAVPDYSVEREREYGGQTVSLFSVDGKTLFSSEKENTKNNPPNTHAGGSSGSGGHLRKKALLSPTALDAAIDEEEEGAMLREQQMHMMKTLPPQQQENLKNIAEPHETLSPTALDVTIDEEEEEAMLREQQMYMMKMMAPSTTAQHETMSKENSAKVQNTPAQFETSAQANSQEPNVTGQQNADCLVHGEVASRSSSSSRREIRSENFSARQSRSYMLAYAIYYIK